jgi:hypothetical protein
VANPPYVISPDLRFDYRDAREQGDRLSRRVLSELPAFLREGGIATMQGNWIHALAEPWFTRPSSCLDGCGCDSLLLRISLTDPLAYAVFWAQHDHPHDPDGFDRTVRRWRASYVASGIERISTAMVIVRRRLAKTNWQRAVSVLGDVTSALGEALPSLFSLQDRFDDLDGEALLELRLCPTAGARMETQLGTEGNGRAILRCNSALGGQRSISLSVAKCIVRFDGEATLRESLAAAGYVDVDPEHAEALAEFRALLLLGYLQPV